MPPRVDARGVARALRSARGRPRRSARRAGGGRAGRGVAADEHSVDQPGPPIHPSERVEEAEVDPGEGRGAGRVAGQQEIEFQSKLFDRFLKRDPPRFQGGSPQQAIEFIRDMKSIFAPMGIVGEMRVEFATYRLHEGARDWWENLSASLTARGEVHVSWERFVELFRENYCLETHMAALERELVSLTQGSRSVEEYEKQFSDMCRLLPDVYPVEAKRITRFRDGLIEEIRHQISLMNFTSLHAVRNAALQKEMELAESRASGLRRSRPETFSTGRPSSSRFQRRTDQQSRPGQSHFSAPTVRPSYSTAPSVRWTPAGSSGVQSGIQGFQRGIICYRCGQAGHRRQDCREKVVTCYRCHQPGHISRDCPQTFTGRGASTSAPVQPSRGGYQGIVEADSVAVEAEGMELEDSRGVPWGAARVELVEDRFMPLLIRRLGIPPGW